MKLIKTNSQKRNLTIFVFLLTLFSGVFLCEQVVAGTSDTNMTSGFINGIYYNQRFPDGRFESNKVSMFKANGNIAYCIEPGVNFTTHTYDSGKDWNITNLSPKQRHNMELIGHYGYDYPGHQTDKYYIATQELIWKEANSNLIVTWSSGQNNSGSQINIENEKAEILRLIARNDVVPSFADSTITINKGETINLTDSNGVLSEYTMLSDGGNNIKVKGNTLTISGTNKRLDDSQANFVRSNYDSFTTLIYYKGQSQKLASVRISDPTVFRLKINTKIKARIVKFDMDSNKSIKLAGAKFKIRSLSTNEYVKADNGSFIFETSSDGDFYISGLNTGMYQVEELVAPIGYLLPNVPSVFSVPDYEYSNEDVLLTVSIMNYKQMGEVELFKKGETFEPSNGNITYTESPLAGVKFNLVADEDIITADGVKHYSKGEVVEELTSDEEGYVKSDKVYLGKYCVVETETPPEYELLGEPQCFSLDYDNSKKVITETINLKNLLKKGQVEIMKVDSLSKEPLAGATFEIYDSNNELVFTGTTGEDGKLLLPSLPYGSYKLVETKVPDKYEMPKDNEYNFIIDDETKTIQIQVKNDKIVEVPNTGLDSSNVLNIVVFVFLTLGIAYIIYDKKKRK